MKQLIRHILREHTREIGEVKKTTTPEFIEKAKRVHGDKYDYSETEYTLGKNKVKIICPKHGEFFQQAGIHLNGQGCPKCALEKRTKSNDEFIKSSKNVHGNYYDYTKTIYVNNGTPVKITCPVHGDFLQSPGHHLNGSGCPKCGLKKISDKFKWNKDEFVKNAIKVHGKKYGYDKVDYTGANVPVIITCPTHGDFKQRPGGHISGKGCDKCANAERGLKMTQDEFIRRGKEIFGNKYDYSKVKYFNSKTPIIVGCPIHGDFEQIPGSFLIGHGCQKCSGKAKGTTESFIENSKKIHGDKYDYSQVNYVRALSPVTIVCKKHGPFEQKPNSHLGGAGCPRCMESKGENLINNLLTSKKIVFVRQKRFTDCTNEAKTGRCVTLPFDFYLPTFNTIIEYDGQQHYVPVWGEDNFKKLQRLDKIRNKYCKKNGIKLIRIPYTMKKEEIEPYILKELGI
jgi:very-short-patch-repair endonuclease